VGLSIATILTMTVLNALRNCDRRHRPECGGAQKAWHQRRREQIPCGNTDNTEEKDPKGRLPERTETAQRRAKARNRERRQDLDGEQDEAARAVAGAKITRRKQTKKRGEKVTPGPNRGGYFGKDSRPIARNPKYGEAGARPVRAVSAGLSLCQLQQKAQEHPQHEGCIPNRLGQRVCLGPVLNVCWVRRSPITRVNRVHSYHWMWRVLEAADSPWARWHPLIGDEKWVSRQSLLYALEVALRVTRKRRRQSCRVLLCNCHAESCSVLVIAGGTEGTLHSHLSGVNRRAPLRRVLVASHLSSSLRPISWTADTQGRCIRKYAFPKIEAVPLTFGR